MSTLENSEDPDEMPYNQGLQCLLRRNQAYKIQEY